MVPILSPIASVSHAHLRLQRRPIRTTIHILTSGRPATQSVRSAIRLGWSRPGKSIVRAIMCKWIAIAADGKGQLESK